MTGQAEAKAEPLRRGDKLEWETAGGRIAITVLRVARDGSWADIRCTSGFNGNSWSKRQKMPGGRLPAGWRKIGPDDATPEERLLLAVFGIDPDEVANVRRLRGHRAECTRHDHSYCWPAPAEDSNREETGHGTTD